MPCASVDPAVDRSLVSRAASRALNVWVIEAVPALVHEVRTSRWPVDEVTDEAKTEDGFPHVRGLPKDVWDHQQRHLRHPLHLLFQLGRQNYDFFSPKSPVWRSVGDLSIATVSHPLDRTSQRFRFRIGGLFFLSAVINALGQVRRNAPRATPGHDKAHMRTAITTLRNLTTLGRVESHCPWKFPSVATGESLGNVKAGDDSHRFGSKNEC